MIRTIILYKVSEKLGEGALTRFQKLEFRRSGLVRRSTMDFTYAVIS